MVPVASEDLHLHSGLVEHKLLFGNFTIEVLELFLAYRRNFTCLVELV